MAATDPVSLTDLTNQLKEDWSSARDAWDEIVCIMVTLNSQDGSNKTLGQRFRTRTCAFEKHLKGMREVTKSIGAAIPKKERPAKRPRPDDEAAAEE